MLAKTERKKQRKAAKKARERNLKDKKLSGQESENCGDEFNLQRIVRQTENESVNRRSLGSDVDQVGSTMGSDKSVCGTVETSTGDGLADEHTSGGSKRGKKRRRDDRSSQEISTGQTNSRKSQHHGSPMKRARSQVQASLGKAGGGTASTGTHSSTPGASSASAQGGVQKGIPTSRLSELQQRMRHKLEGAHFRMINETLYTSESKTALAKFQEKPELFDVYHRGFREQVEKWPVHPLDVIIKWLRKYPKARVADFGCGEARLAATVPNKVYSFDLVSPNPRVTACDMADVPLKDSSVHVVVFCLSLMGTNLADFLREAHRVLLPGGLVKVAEVRSRFEGDEGGVDRFLEMTERLGFDAKQMDRSNKMFLLAEFKKSSRRAEVGIDFQAKACVYKRR